MTAITREPFWTIPNILSLYRIVVFPLIGWFIFRKEEQLFAIFIVISLFTDILDGLIARLFNMQTAIGAKLDSWGDTGTYLLAFAAIYVFKWPELKPHAWILIVFVAIWVLSYAVVFIKFKGLIGLHTWLFKITGYVQGAFIVLLFTVGFIPWFFYVCIGIGTLACIEEIIIILILRQPRSNLIGLYNVLKNKLR